ncbi:hypothetical protein FK535_23005 [Mycolicibacterium sp. 018/SC-01/001]|uniref:hypothetical protein n=1 Tax=Mycolicibacterium sp. 018/SC-01/001 TaxID=2592069 RepID=UPI001180346F|nr:hypothetical protein [Mycolicibacterium sp. 018/SC-01/001]TRW79102.1 hypothetical protein FK535_23005 [Mycolicibacterium sp. 018/SC-01/001]
MNNYSEQSNLIKQILEPVLDVSTLTATSPSVFEAGAPWERTVFRWSSSRTSEDRSVAVYVGTVSDGAQKAAEIRDMIATETMPGDDAFELAASNDGEYVFTLGYLGRVTALAGVCQVDIFPSPATSLTSLAEPALQIARTVGTSQP